MCPCVCCMRIRSSPPVVSVYKADSDEPTYRYGGMVNVFHNSDDNKLGISMTASLLDSWPDNVEGYMCVFTDEDGTLYDGEVLTDNETGARRWIDIPCDEDGSPAHPLLPKGGAYPSP